MKFVPKPLVGVIFCLVSKFAFTQVTLDYKLLSVNNVRTGLNANGTLFYKDALTSPFQVPYNGEDNSPSAMTIGNMVMGARDEAGNVKVAAGLYQTLFQPGFLNSDTGLESQLALLNQNRVWSVTRSQVEDHIAKVASGDINYVIPKDIDEWPATGNPYYEERLGSRDTPFHDKNANGLYEPSLGDYPTIGDDMQGVIPDQLLYSISNDLGHNFIDTELRLTIEVHTLLYAFDDEGNDAVNNSVFQRQIIKSRASNSIEDLYVGLWFDPDLGCPSNDRIGCDTLVNAVYTYNDSEVDEEMLNQCDAPDFYYPYSQGSQVLVTRLLSHDIDNFIGWGSRPFMEEFGTDGNNNQVDISGSGLYDLLRGRWSNDHAMTISGDGYNPDFTGLAETNYIYHDNPNAENAWTAPSDNYKMLINIGVPFLVGNWSMTVDCVHTFSQSETLNNVEVINIGLEESQSAAEYLNGQLVADASAITTHQISIFPNPTSDLMTVQSDGVLVSYQLMHLDGRRVQAGSMLETHSIDVSSLQGIYHLLLTFDDGSVWSERVVVID